MVCLCMLKGFLIEKSGGFDKDVHDISTTPSVLLVVVSGKPKRKSFA